MFEKVEKATVKLAKKKGGGHGVIVGGGFILTAAHCVTWNGGCGMALGDYCLEEIEKEGNELTVQPYAVEPCADIAVLGVLGDQAFASKAGDYEEFLTRVEPATLCRNIPEVFSGFSIWVLSKHAKWIEGEAMLCQEGAGTLFVSTKNEIEGGASGGPIVNSEGELVAIVSNSSSGDDDMNFPDYEGSHPMPLRTLPLWILDKILRTNTN